METPGPQAFPRRRSKACYEPSDSCCGQQVAPAILSSSFLSENLACGAD
jgi:hypothetical protein